MKPVPNQLHMPFLGAVEGASLEAQVARMHRMVEGLNVDQLRRLYREQKGDGIDAHVRRVIEDALIAAIRLAPAEGEDVPNEYGVITKAEPDWQIGVVLLQMKVFTGRTRWGYVAAVDFSWRGDSSGVAPLRVAGETFRTRALAAAHALDDFAAHLRDSSNADLADDYLLDCGMAIGVLTERAFMLRMGVWPRGKEPFQSRRTRPKSAARKKNAAIPAAMAVDGPARERQQSTTRVAPSAVGAGSGRPHTAKAPPAEAARKPAPKPAKPTPKAPAPKQPAKKPANGFRGTVPGISRRKPSAPS